MEITRTFETGDLFWSCCFEEDGRVDILTVLFDKWSSTQYLTDFFTENIKDLSDPFWGSISVAAAVNMVKTEVAVLEEKLICIQIKEPGCENVSVGDVFENLHKNGYRVNLKKGKVNHISQMLRIYAIELEDGTMVITGGAIKICRLMDRAHLEFEILRLKRVEDFLNENFIVDKAGLL